MEDFNNDIAVINSISAVPLILDVLCRTTGMGFAAVARVTETRWIACRVLDNIQFGLGAGGELKVETTICHEIRQSRNPVIIDHVETDEEYRDHPTPRMYGFQSYISMPIFLPGDRFFGTLCSIDPRPARVKTPEIIGMFKLFAELIALHIDGAEKLTRSEANLLAAQEIAELREQFIGVLGHDLRTPLGAILMGTSLMKATGNLSESNLKTLEMMRRSTTRMSELIQDAMDFTRGRLGGGVALEDQSDAPLEPVLREVIHELRINWPDREIVEEIAITEPLHYDRKRLVQLFSNLLSNAMIHGKKDHPVSVKAKTGDGIFELSVANAADPIPPDKLVRLFEPFARGGTKDYKQGLGLGLYIASEIAKSHGGTLRVHSDESETRFTFAMPTVQGGK